MKNTLLSRGSLWAFRGLLLRDSGSEATRRLRQMTRILDQLRRKLAAAGQQTMAVAHLA